MPPLVAEMAKAPTINPISRGSNPSAAVSGREYLMMSKMAIYMHHIKRVCPK